MDEIKALKARALKNRENARVLLKAFKVLKAYKSLLKKAQGGEKNVTVQQLQKQQQDGNNGEQSDASKSKNEEDNKANLLKIMKEKMNENLEKEKEKEKEKKPDKEEPGKNTNEAPTAAVEDGMKEKNLLKMKIKMKEIMDLQKENKEKTPREEEAPKEEETPKEEEKPKTPKEEEEKSKNINNEEEKSEKDRFRMAQLRLQTLQDKAGNNPDNLKISGTTADAPAPVVGTENKEQQQKDISELLKEEANKEKLSLPSSSNEANLNNNKDGDPKLQLKDAKEKSSDTENKQQQKDISELLKEEANKEKLSLSSPTSNEANLNNNKDGDLKLQLKDTKEKSSDTEKTEQQQQKQNQQQQEAEKINNKQNNDPEKTAITTNAKESQNDKDSNKMVESGGEKDGKNNPDDTWKKAETKMVGTNNGGNKTADESTKNAGSVKSEQPPSASAIDPYTTFRRSHLVHHKHHHHHHQKRHQIEDEVEENKHDDGVKRFIQKRKNIPLHP